MNGALGVSGCGVVNHHTQSLNLDLSIDKPPTLTRGGRWFPLFGPGVSRNGVKAVRVERSAAVAHGGEHGRNCHREEEADDDRHDDGREVRFGRVGIGEEVHDILRGC